MKKLIKILIVLVSTCFVIGCSTPLTREAQSIVTISDGGIIA
jgi:hypothetical protein